MKRGPKPSGKAMTAAQRQARYRAAHAEGEPRLRYCRPADRRSMAQRWRDAGGGLLDLQGAYRSALETFVKVVFKDHYEQEWLTKLKSGTPSSAYRYFDRLQEV